MNDCLWYSIGVCNGDCLCKKYLSMNSDEGQKVGMQWERLVGKTLEPLAKVFAKENGFIDEV